LFKQKPTKEKSNMTDSQYENIQTLQFRDPQTSTQGGLSLRPNMGGVVQYDLPSTPSDNLHTFQPVQQGVGSITTVNIGAGTNQSAAVHTVSTADLNGGHSDFLATARNHGMRAMGELNADTVVTFQGMEVSLAQLEAMGEVKRTAGRSYEVANTAPNQQEPTEQSLPPGVELFSVEVETQVAQAIAEVPQQIYDSAVAQILEQGIDNVSLNDLAFQSGITPEVARARAETVIQAFTQQADSLAKSSGISDPSEIWQWASSERSEDFAAAKREMAFGRSTAGLRSLVADYFKSVPPSIEALTKAGIPIRTGSLGETVAFIKGTWMDLSTAASAGLL
jgi:hypothetical protein